MMSCTMVGAYSSSVLTGSVSSSSVVPPQWLVATNYSLVHDAMGLRFMSLKSMVFQLLVVLFASA